MKKILNISAIAVIIISTLAWVLMGANRGWTKTSVPVKALDEVTGIESIQYRSQFVPGVELLGAAFMGAAILAGIALFINKKPKSQSKS
jgi:hypothetical protein